MDNGLIHRSEKYSIQPETEYQRVLVLLEQYKDYYVEMDIKLGVKLVTFKTITLKSFSMG